MRRRRSTAAGAGTAATTTAAPSPHRARTRRARPRRPQRPLPASQRDLGDDRRRRTPCAPHSGRRRSPRTAADVGPRPMRSRGTSDRLDRELGTLTGQRHAAWQGPARARARVRRCRAAAAASSSSPTRRARSSTWSVDAILRYAPRHGRSRTVTSRSRSSRATGPRRRRPASNSSSRPCATARPSRCSPIARAVVYALVGGTAHRGVADHARRSCLIRLLNNYLPGDVWVTYVVLGAVFFVVGLVLWTQARAAPRSPTPGRQRSSTRRRPTS